MEPPSIELFASLMNPVYHNVIAGLGLATIVAVGLITAMPKIESDIKGRVLKDLQHISWVLVEVEGRAVSISGVAPAGGAPYVKRRLKGISGVRQVTVHSPVAVSHSAKLNQNHR